MKYLILIFSFIPWILSGQEVYRLSLDEAKSYALEHSYDMMNSKLDVKIAKKQVDEILTTGFPQINGSISNTNYIDIPTQLLPDFITPAVYQANQQYFGLTPEQPLGEPQFFPVQFGTEHNATLSASVSQLIFSGEFFIGLRASRNFLELTRIQNVKNEVETKLATSRAYFSVLLAEENYDILEENLESTKEMEVQTREMFKAGFIDETEADQLSLLVANLETAIISLRNQRDLAYSNLKLILGMNLSDSITLTNDLQQLIEEDNYKNLISEDFDYNDNLDYLVLTRQKELAVNQVQRQKVAYLPNISAFFTAQTQAMRSEYNFFDDKEPWYPSSLWGFEMKIPIWSSGNRSSKVQIAKMELEKLQNLDNKLKTGLRINVTSARSDLYNALLVYQNKKKNMELAKRINLRTEEKFKEGVSSSMDLLQASNQFLTAQSEYIGSLMDLINAKLTLDKLLYEEDEL